MSLLAYSLILLGLCLWFFHFLHFVFKVFDHLYYHYSEFFSSKFAYFFLIYLDFCVSKLLLHLHSISLSFHDYDYHYSDLLCLRSPFPSLQGKLNSFLEEGWILSSFRFLPSYGWSNGLGKFSIGWELCWRFICLFVFPLMIKAEWGANLVCWRLGLYFWCQVFYSSGFLCVSYHYLIFHSVISLVV